MGKNSSGPSSTEDVLAWRRRRQREVAKAKNQSVARGSDWKAIHGAGEGTVERTSSTRRDVNSYGSAPTSIQDVGVIKRRT